VYAQQCVQPTGTNRPRAWGSCSLWKARGVVGNNTSCGSADGRRASIVPLERKVSGDHSGRVTPVPIPNTEVKPASADGTWGETPWESRSSPEFISDNAHLHTRVGIVASQAMATVRSLSWPIRVVLLLNVAPGFLASWLTRTEEHRRRLALAVTPEP
jgi:hypothetical protein